MNRTYYSSRNKQKILLLDDLYLCLINLFLYFQERDFFKEKLDITRAGISDNAERKAGFTLNFNPFPIDKWDSQEITEDHIFDLIEFLHDHVSEPGEMVDMVSETNWHYRDYREYNSETGQNEFRGNVNVFLCNYKKGYELTEDGEILSLGDNGLRHILMAEIVPYDEINVDNKVKDAILKWRNRHVDLNERRAAIREFADVFEWLKKTDALKEVLKDEDSSLLFNIANNFNIRHHNPDQKRGYDESIWYAWIFHFYLATYHATIRLIKKHDSK